VLEVLVEQTKKSRKVIIYSPKVEYWRNRIDPSLLFQSPANRLAQTYFRETGVLLPFGASCRSFDISNPQVYNQLQVS
jgi:hypothetical protein